ncbi:MAG: hypothetical protein CVT49_14170 [candidate division Zixibacteria bacterium HGW-Zixibacteria-1]|nr:MAG: hypothetical protein CVT49_14170 [candidate division Zixibacteria bacterium HGW-Zixibacteria-1]
MGFSDYSINFFKRNYSTLITAPLTFIILFGLGLTGGFFISTWYFAGQIETLKTHLDYSKDRLVVKEEQLNEYRQRELRLNIRKTSLTELTNSELRDLKFPRFSGHGERILLL